MQGGPLDGLCMSVDLVIGQHDEPNGLYVHAAPKVTGTDEEGPDDWSAYYGAELDEVTERGTPMLWDDERSTPTPRLLLRPTEASVHGEQGES